MDCPKCGGVMIESGTAEYTVEQCGNLAIFRETRYFCESEGTWHSTIETLRDTISCKKIAVAD